MVAVQTISGPVDSAALGRTLAHEHLCGGMPGMERLGMFDLEGAVRRDIEALTNARAAGIRTLIDCTTLDLGRQVKLLERLAVNSPVQIIACTGVYRNVPTAFFTWNSDTVAQYFLRELQEGIEGTKVRAGVIKIAWDYEYRVDDGPMAPRAMLEKCARGAARAAKVAGVPILCHHRAEDRTGERMLDLFAEEGVDLRAVTIGHSNDALESEYVVGLARRGATVGLDRFNPAKGMAELERRSRLALDVVKAGYAKQMTLGHDRSPYSLNGGPPEGGPRAEDPQCFMRVSEIELPWMKKNGATEADIEATMTESVRAMFEAAGAMRKG